MRVRSLLLCVVFLGGAVCSQRRRPSGSLPQITFTERAARGGMRADDCRWEKLDDWRARGMKPGGDAVACRLTQARAVETLFLTWTAYDDGDEPADRGSVGGLPWRERDESRLVRFDIESSARDRIARIEVDAN